MPPLRIGREEDIEGRPLRNLRIELAGGSEAQQGLMAGRLGKARGDLLSRIREIRRDRHMGFAGMGDPNAGDEEHATDQRREKAGGDEAECG